MISFICGEYKNIKLMKQRPEQQLPGLKKWVKMVKGYKLAVVR